MEPAMTCRQCGHSQLDDIVSPAFTDSTTELTYIDKQIDQISSQINRLKGLQSALWRRSNQLRSPIYVIPVEVMTQIFQQLCNSTETHVGRNGWEITPHAIHRDAVTLSAVSSHWRQVAFATSRLWERVHFELDSYCRAGVDNNAALLQHFASHAGCLDVSFISRDNDGMHGWAPLSPDKCRPVTRVLFSPDVARRVKVLNLDYPLLNWIPMLPSFPLLNTLALRNVITPHDTTLSLDLQACPLSRVCLQHIGSLSVTLPPSVQVLHLYDVGSEISMALLRQCPNLVQCVNDVGVFGPDRRVSFTTHIALNHLKTLVWPLHDCLDNISSIRNLRVPALEHLKLTQYGGRDIPEASAAITLLCQRLSTTLSSLTLEYFLEWTFDTLRGLFEFPLHNLRILKLESWHIMGLLEAIRSLTPSQDEYNNHEIKCLPSLESLTLTTSGDESGDELFLPFSRLLLDLLERRRAGETFRFRLNFTVGGMRGLNEDDLWPLELQEELRVIVNNRQVDVERAPIRIEWL